MSLVRQLALTVLLGWFAAVALGREELIPMRSAIDLSQGVTKVFVTAPRRWQKRRNVGYGVGFGLSPKPEFPVLEVSAFHLGRSDSLDLSPKNSDTMGNWAGEMTVTELHQVGLVNGGGHGKLPLWQIRSRGDDFLLVIILEERTRVEVSLRDHDADKLEPYLEDLEETARSIQIVATRPNQAMQRTAGRSAFQLVMTSIFTPQPRALSPAVADLVSR